MQFANRLGANNALVVNPAFARNDLTTRQSFQASSQALAGTVAANKPTDDDDKKASLSLYAGYSRGYGTAKAKDPVTAGDTYVYRYGFGPDIILPAAYDEPESFYGPRFFIDSNSIPVSQEPIFGEGSGSGVVIDRFYGELQIKGPVEDGGTPLFVVGYGQQNMKPTNVLDNPVTLPEYGSSIFRYAKLGIGWSGAKFSLTPYIQFGKAQGSVSKNINGQVLVSSYKSSRPDYTPTKQPLKFYGSDRKLDRKDNVAWGLDANFHLKYFDIQLGYSFFKKNFITSDSPYNTPTASLKFDAAGNPVYRVNDVTTTTTTVIVNGVPTTTTYTTVDQWQDYQFDGPLVASDTPNARNSGIKAGFFYAGIRYPLFTKRF